MNERFKELSEEKRNCILNAAMEVFSKYEYKKASTDLIAAKAGVSKGLLFYYFRNKKELYLAVYEYVRQTVIEAVYDKKLADIEDFFELISYASIKKIKMMTANPYIFDFCVRAYYSTKEDVSDKLMSINMGVVRESYETYFKRLDYSKFKEDAKPEEIFKMLIWLMDGYVHEQQMNKAPLRTEELEEKFKEWVKMFKNIAYKEEYL